MFAQWIKGTKTKTVILFSCHKVSLVLINKNYWTNWTGLDKRTVLDEIYSTCYNHFLHGYTVYSSCSAVSDMQDSLTPCSSGWLWPYVSSITSLFVADLLSLMFCKSQPSHHCFLVSALLKFLKLHQSSARFYFGSLGVSVNSFFKSVKKKILVFQVFKYLESFLDFLRFWGFFCVKHLYSFCGVQFFWFNSILF